MAATATAVAARSPHAHARILKVDTATAAGMPGVRRIFTGADVRAWCEEGEMEAGMLGVWRGRR